MGKWMPSCSWTGDLRSSQERSQEPAAEPVTSEEDTRVAASVGFSFDLRVQYSSNELCEKMTERLLNWAGVREPTDVPLVVTRVVEIVNNGERENEFFDWCKNCHGSIDLNFIDKRWAKLIFGSLALAIYSEYHRQQNLSVVATLSYWTLWVGTQYCAGHRSLNRFAARWDDPVWESIHPPNGWMCGCGVTPCLESEPEVLASRRRRLSAAMREKCTSWFDKRPIAQLRLL